jgi:hypothetical protein
MSEVQGRSGWGQPTGQTHQIPRGFTGEIGKPKIQIPNPKQIPRSQMPKPGIGFRVGTWSLDLIWVLGFGISRTEWKTFDAPWDSRAPVRRESTVCPQGFRRARSEFMR